MVQGHDESYHPDVESLRDLVHENGATKDRKFIVFENS